ncbi:MAG: nucleotidyltransferase family protein [Candidatus Micrarchaeales archaeon]
MKNEFENHLRKIEISNVPVIFLVGGKATRMSSLPYAALVGKPFLPISLNTKNLEIETLFFRNFKIFYELGIKNFYLILREESEGKKVEEYIKRIIKEINNKDEKINVQLLSKDFSQKETKERNVYIVVNPEEKILKQILNLQPLISTPFVVVMGDVYYNGEEDELKEEIKRVIKIGIEKINKRAIMFDAVLEKEQQLGKIDWNNLFFKLDKDGKMVKCSQEESLVFASISILSQEIFDFLKKTDASNLHSKEFIEELLKSGRLYGEKLNIFSINVNHPEDWRKVVEEAEKRRKQKVTT